MAISARHYVFEDDGSLKLVPSRVASGIHLGEDRIPAYAGTSQRVAQVIIENEDGKPTRILDARGFVWVFDGEGNLVHEHPVNVMDRHMRASRTPKGKVVDLRPKIELKQWERDNLWDLTAEDLDRITAALWPTAESGTTAVGSVKGTARKIPPLSNEGRRALTQVVASVSRIRSELDALGESALKGIAHELRRVGQYYESEQAFYEAAASAADHQREILARHRTGRGAWYALVRITHWSDPETEPREIDVVEELCPDREAAVEAARRLLSENAHRFSPGLTLEAEVLSEMEWKPRRHPRAEDEDGTD